MALATQDDYIAAKANAKQPTSYWKNGATREAVGTYHLCALQDGFPGAWSPGSPGTAGRATDGLAAADGGCMPFVEATSPNKQYLDSMTISATVAGTRLQLIDLLWCNTGIVVTTTTAQTWTPVAAPARDVDGATAGRGVEVALFVTSATTNGAAISGATISYTNSAGTPGRTATSSAANPIPATAVAGTLVIFALQAGDVGVRSVEGITLGTSLGAGSVSVVLLRRLTGLFMTNTLDSLSLSLLDLGVQILAGACVFPLDLALATTATPIIMWASTVEG